MYQRLLTGVAAQNRTVSIVDKAVIGSGKIRVDDLSRLNREHDCPYGIPAIGQAAAKSVGIGQAALGSRGS